MLLGRALLSCTLPSCVVQKFIDMFATIYVTTYVGIHLFIYKNKTPGVFQNHFATAEIEVGACTFCVNKILGNIVAIFLEEAMTITIPKQHID